VGEQRDGGSISLPCRSVKEAHPLLVFSTQVREGEGNPNPASPAPKREKKREGNRPLCTLYFRSIGEMLKLLDRGREKGDF